MEKLWKKGSANNTNSSKEIADQVEAFTVGEDYLLDRELIPADVAATRAHASGLARIDILDGAELKRLNRALDLLMEQWESGEFQIHPSQEDGHTAIEQFLVEHAGEVGKKVHTGRSRNDQVLAAMRLYEKDKLLGITGMVKDTGMLFLQKAEQYAGYPMPGYTHTQRAMLSSVGMWMASHAEMLLLDLEPIAAAWRTIDRNPLGTAAGYGVTLDLPRDEVRKELGFRKNIVVSLTAQNTRGKIDIQLLNALQGVADTLAHYANDLVWYCNREHGFFTLDDALCTGSSIMPQKRNPDAAEILRAKAGAITGAAAAVQAISAKLTSGYHRDLQLIKKYIMQSISDIEQMLQMAQLLVRHTEPNREVLEAACTGELFAADRANQYVKEGMSFRDAYHRVKSEIDTLQTDEGSIAEQLQSRTHLGATGNLGIGMLREEFGAFGLE